MSFVRALVRDKGLEREAVAGDGWLANPAIVTDATDAAATITVAAIQAGVWQRTTLTATRADTFPIATLILAALPFMNVGDTYPFVISNSDASDKITATTAAGITLSGNVDILANTFRIFLIRKTSEILVDIIGL